MPETKRPLKVFLSYASQDRPVVRELSGRLAGEGWIDPWVDEKKLLPGQDWRLNILDAVETSDIVIICLSSNSVSKEGYVQKELRYAQEIALEKPEGTIFLIPLRLEECEVPRGLRFYQWVDFFGENKDTSYSALVESLKLRHEQKLMLEEQTRVQKEKLEREAAEKIAQEKATREKAEKDAKEKARLEAEKLVKQKAAREKKEREAAEKAVYEKEEKDAAEKARLEGEEQARQKAAKEKEERETAEKAAQEQAEREAAEIVAREKAKRDAAKKADREANERKKPVSPKELVDEKPLVVEDKVLSKLTQEQPNKKPVQPSIFVLGGIAVFIIGIVIFYSLSNMTRGANPIPTNIEPTSTHIEPSQPVISLEVTNTSEPSPTSIETSAIIVPALSTEITDSKDVSMRLVPASEFSMGSASNFSDPAQIIYLDAFYIDKYEVTNASYKACFDAGVCLQKPKDFISNTHSYYYGKAEFNNYPVIYVDWYMANIYCEWRGARLPTEAEWEKAARGTDGRDFPWGNDANFNDFSHDNTGKGNSGDTTEVGRYETGKSPYGVYDLGGNVWEWVSSIYKPYPYNSSDGRENLHISGIRVLRGGSWKSMGIEDQTNYRYRLDPANAKNDIGFRCARLVP